MLCCAVACPQLKQPQKEAEEQEEAPEAPVKGVSIKPFTVKTARPSMIKGNCAARQTVRRRRLTPTPSCILQRR